MCSVCNCTYNTVIHIETCELRPLMHSMYSLNSKWSANTGQTLCTLLPKQTVTGSLRRVCFWTLLRERVVLCLSTGRTLQHPEYVGLVGLVIGIGEISGGAIFGIFGKRTQRFGRDPIVILGMLLHMVCFLLIFYIIPNDTTTTLHPSATPFLIDNTS